MMRRGYVFIALCVLGLLLAADFAYWRFVVGQLRQGLDSWEAGLRTEGWEIGSGPAAAGGWPLTARLTIPNPTLRHERTSGPGMVSLAAPSVALSVALWHPYELRLPIASPVHLRAEGMPDIILTADGMGLDEHLRANETPPVAFRAHDLRLEPADGIWHAAAGQVALDTRVRPAPEGGGHTPGAADFTLSARAITLPGTVRWALGQTMAQLTVRGSLSGKLPSAGALGAWAAAWRDDGGSLEISHYGVMWGPLDLSGSATLALDDQLQPMGTGTAHIVGYADTLDRLAAAGVMTRSAATAAKAVLSLMAGVGEGDAPPSVDVPLTLQYRTLSIRQVPLVRLPELDWPAVR